MSGTALAIAGSEWVAKLNNRPAECVICQMPTIGRLADKPVCRLCVMRHQRPDLFGFQHEARWASSLLP
jgi:hypothetical protein